jgi:chemotaxis protein methyltransferase CheR
MEISPQDFRDIQTLVRRLCGLVLTDDKTYLVQSRLEEVVAAHGFAHFSDYLGRVQQLNSKLMRDELVEALTTGETSFNRDSHPFDEFRRRILPELGETIRLRRENHYPVPICRLWSAGCSTGQEPYSLAMAVHDFVSGNPALALRPEHFPILATDVSNRSLNTARLGRYLAHQLDRGLPAEPRRRHFRQEGDAWIAQDGLRRSIEFRRLNLMDDLSNLGPFDVIFCRNVLIYFDTPMRRRLCDQFHELLNPGGLLMVGAAESLYGIATPFVPELVGATTVYRKAGRAT